MNTRSYRFNDTSLTPPFQGGCHNQWFDPSSIQYQQIALGLKHWLFDRGSLTSRLKNHCQEFSVVVLNNELIHLSTTEKSLFSAAELSINCREVLLVCDGIPQVYARSLIPVDTMLSTNVGLNELGNNSLGQILFQASHAHRCVFEATCFQPGSTIHRLSGELGLNTNQELWGRRSLFTLTQYPLLVSEIFLPGSLAYQETI